MNIAIVSLIYKILSDVLSGSILATYKKGRQNRSAWCTSCRYELRYCKLSSSAEMWWMAFSLHAFASVDPAEGENVQRLWLFSWLYCWRSLWIFSPDKPSQRFWYLKALGWIFQFSRSIYHCQHHNILLLYNVNTDCSSQMQEHTVGHQLTKGWHVSPVWCSSSQ